MPGSSLAAVFHGPGQPFTLEYFPIPTLTGTEALVRILCCTICGSDLHTATGRRISPAPSILGHEMIGEIVDAGPEGAIDYYGARLDVGDRVTWSMVWRHGESVMKFGHEQITPDRALIGGMAEYCYLPKHTAIFRVPANLSNLAACPANCATATVAAVLRAAGPLTGETVVIFGMGMLGLTACAMAREEGAAQVIAIEPNRERLELAGLFGATIFDGTTDSTEQATVALEFSGQPQAFEQGTQLLKKGGRFILAGATFPSRPAQIDAELLVRRMLTITGVYNYRPEDLARALRFLSSNVHSYPFNLLVPMTFSLKNVDAAIAFAERSHPPRVALIP